MSTTESALSRKLARFLPRDAVELATLARLEGRAVEAGTELAREGGPARRAFLVRRGWIYSYKLLPDGGRQVIELAIPGDILSLHGLLLGGDSDRAIAAVTPALVAELSREQVTTILSSQPRLAAALVWATARDEAVTVERLVSLGRRHALERMAHLLLELGQRLKLVGLGAAADYACPLSQYLLADALGLTPIHVNRVLRQLRERGLVTFRGGRVVIHNLERLRELVAYDNSYLDPVCRSESDEDGTRLQRADGVA